jgi:hypothetical protein
MRWHWLGCLLLCGAACAPQVVEAVDDPALSGAGAGQRGDTGGATSGGAADRPDADLPDADRPDADLPDADHSDAGGAPPEATLRGDALIHRYSFSGTGSTVLDEKGAAHGSVIGAQLSGKGSLVLDGTAATAEYVDLPNQLISGLGDATFEVWLTWKGGDVWQRIIDFGDDASHVEDARSTGGSYLFLSPHGAGDYWRVVYRAVDANEIIIDVKPALPANTAKYVAIVFDDSHDEMRVYVDGVLSGSVAVPGKLSQIHDVNDWLGRSQFAADPALSASIDELRIYDQALSSAEIEKSMQAGPDAVFPDP